MTYVLRALGTNDLVAIDEATFSQVKIAKDALVTMIGIEQKFDLLFENYADYERDLLELGLQELLHNDHEWSSFQDDIALVSRRLANLLSAARLFLDQVKHDLSTTFGSSSEIVQVVKEKASAQYDARFGYRFMETLRNVLQHESMPVHEIAYSRETAAQGLLFRVVPRVSVARLKGSCLKATVLVELEALGEKVDLSPLVREYVEGLAAVHEAIRELAAPHVAAWDSTLASVQAQGAAPNGGDARATILAMKLDQNEHVIETVPVFLDLTNYRRGFERRNGVLGALSQRYVSSQGGKED
jgi:hypothetical protein